MTTDPLDSEEDTFEVETYTWEDSYALARALRRAHPDVTLEDVSLGMLYQWTLALPGFADDPQLANEAILMFILQEWFEENNPL